MKIAGQPYYRWLARPVTAAKLEHAYRANALFDAHRDDSEFGYRFLVDEARHAGELTNSPSACRSCVRAQSTHRPSPPCASPPTATAFSAGPRRWFADHGVSSNASCSTTGPPTARPAAANFLRPPPLRSLVDRLTFGGNMLETGTSPTAPPTAENSLH
ncbi:hypothetical protein [Kribbella pittospori]|uniref:hypothetical protein n=1 Tax=Kribbella pittospori TaxID=722689 RepID=UPI00192D35D4|nr:hypothetical protein [Kribbella pittospori]